MTTNRCQNLLGAFALAVADRIRDETEAAVGHTGAAASALVTIAHYPGRNVEFLRQAIGLSHPAAVRAVDRLVEKRLVRRGRGDHGPAVSLTTTTSGHRQALAILDVRRTVLADALPRLSRAESQTLEAILDKALMRMSDSPGSTVCRLCDHGRCPRRDCPIVVRQTQLGAPPPEPVALG